MARYPSRWRTARNAAVVLAGVLLPMTFSTGTVATATDSHPGATPPAPPAVATVACTPAGNGFRTFC